MTKEERLKKIEEYERAGLFDIDIEDDPPSRELSEDEIDYSKKSLFQKIKTKVAFFLAYRYAAKLERKKILVIDKVVGAENLNTKSGCVIAANHFSPLDSFIMNRVFDLSGRKGKIHRIIKEGNFTSFPGFYGFLMRNCNTMPLSKNPVLLTRLMRAANERLKRGDAILVYPEQSMWYNYRKPKPLKSGAFDIAVRGEVPVVPVFITMRDTDILLPDGDFAEAHTVFVGKPIYPDQSLPRRERSEKMKNEVFEFNRCVYESFYEKKLEYLS